MSHSSVPLRRVLAGAASICVLFAAAPAPAQTRSDFSALASGEATVISRMQEMPDEQLKAFFLRCSNAAGERMLDFGDAVLCSTGYETLLKRSFDGDFTMLLAWWKQYSSASQAVHD